jgi:hypothetical protein
VDASLTISLSSSDVVFGAAQRMQLAAALAQSLGVAQADVYVTAVTPVVSAHRRRRALLAGATVVRVDFSLRARDAAAAAALSDDVTALFATPTAAQSFVSTLHGVGLAAAAGAVLTEVPVVVMNGGGNVTPASSSSSGGGGAANTAAIAGGAGGGGGGGLLLLLGGLLLEQRRRLRRGEPPLPLCLPKCAREDEHASAEAGVRRRRRELAASGDDARAAYLYDVFLSYRRTDAEVVNVIEDKLGHRDVDLRVFRDVRGAMAGVDFDVELARFMRASAVFVPVLTLGALRRLADVTPTVIDITCAEYAMALWLLHVGRIRGVCPLVVGEEHVQSDIGMVVLDNLFHNPEFRAAKAALPRTAPAATWRFVRATLAALGETLPPAWEAMSVHDIMCASQRMSAPAKAPLAHAKAAKGGGHADADEEQQQNDGDDDIDDDGEAALPHVQPPPFSGLLIKDCFFLDGQKEKLRLVLREFAAVIRQRIGARRDEGSIAAPNDGEDTLVAAEVGLGDAMQAEPAARCLAALAQTCARLHTHG